MTDEWDDYAATWDDDAAARAYAAAAFTSLEAALAARGRSVTGAVICDFGCGTGLLSEKLAPTAASIDAVDTSPAMIAQLTAKADRLALDNVRPAATLPTSTASHDLVVCSSVLGFVDDLSATVSQLTKLLRPGGVFVQWDWERDPAADEQHGLTRDEVKQAMAAAGLTAIHVETGFEVPYEGNVMSPLMGVGERH